MQYEAVVKEIVVLNKIRGGAVDLQHIMVTQQGEKNVEGEIKGNDGYGFISYL